MNIREFAKPVTAKSLNESLAKRFGKRISLESFTLGQLQNARNKLRTTLSQVEMSEAFNAVIESENYQKNKMFLDVLNAEISERGDIDEPVLESIVTEGAEDQAEIVMAAKGMVDKVTGWMEDTAEMQTEGMLELADAIRDEMGVEQSTQFVEAIKPALEAIYTAMEGAREALASAVGMLTGETPAPTEMGMEEPMDAEPGMEPTVDMEEPLAAGEGEGAVAAPAAGGTAPAGREQRESVQPRKLGTVLAGSKKK
jgi:hypothetical protein